MKREDTSPPLILSALFLLPLSLFVLFLFCADLILPQDVQRHWWWAGLQLYDFPVGYRIFAALLPLLPLLAPADSIERLVSGSRRVGKAIHDKVGHPIYAVPIVGIFLWIFRSSSLRIGDAQFYVSDLIPREAFSDRGLIINYDSIGTTFFYSRGFHFAKLYFSLDALTWYNLFGLICLGVFLWWAWKGLNKGRILGGGAALALLLAGNWNQAALGAPEHYGQVLLCAAAFGILSVETLRGREPLWKPCLAFAIGAFFHLIIGWLSPALIYLMIARWKKETPDGRTLAICALVIPAFLTGLLAYYYGFELSYMFASNTAQGELIPFLSPQDPYTGMNFHYTTFDPRHLAHIGQEIILMGWPGLIALVAGAPVLHWNRLRGDQPFIFLLFLFAGSLVLNVFWNPDLEFWRDQDLFSIIGLSTCLLGAYALLGPSGSDIDSVTRKRIFIAALSGGIAWRAAVIIWHSLLTVYYYNPKITSVVWPFGIQ